MLVFSNRIFESFQTDSPVLPFMYDELKETFTKYLGLICKQNAVSNDKDFNNQDKKWLSDKENLLDTNQVGIGAATPASLKDLLCW